MSLSAIAKTKIGCQVEKWWINPIKAYNAIMDLRGWDFGIVLSAQPMRLLYSGDGRFPTLEVMVGLAIGLC